MFRSWGTFLFCVHLTSNFCGQNVMCGHSEKMHKWKDEFSDVLLTVVRFKTVHDEERGVSLRCSLTSLLSSTVPRAPAKPRSHCGDSRECIFNVIYTHYTFISKWNVCCPISRIVTFATDNVNRALLLSAMKSFDSAEEGCPLLCVYQSWGLCLRNFLRTGILNSFILWKKIVPSVKQVSQPAKWSGQVKDEVE